MEKRKKGEGEQKPPPPPSASIPIDLLPEILSRVPYRSLCRFKCVSRAWLALCSDPAVRRRSPQALSGFFCYSLRHEGSSHGRSRIDFLNLSGWGRPLVDPSLRFVRGYQEVSPLHCCGGILICYCWKVDMEEAEYVVCNPATEEIWAVLAAPRNELMKGLNNTRLCFDPAVPRRFTVFVFMHNFTGIIRVEVYSSETGQWTSLQSEWSPETVVLGEDSRCVFFNGALHLATCHSRSAFDQEGKLIRWIVTVDSEGKTWRRIQMPHYIDSSGIIGQSQGRLCAARIGHGNGGQLVRTGRGPVVRAAHCDRAARSNSPFYPAHAVPSRAFSLLGLNKRRGDFSLVASRREDSLSSRRDGIDLRLQPLALYCLETAVVIQDQEVCL